MTGSEIAYLLWGAMGGFVVTAGLAVKIVDGEWRKAHATTIGAQQSWERAKGSWKAATDLIEQIHVEWKQMKARYQSSLEYAVEQVQEGNEIDIKRVKAPKLN